jgi:hypothetical protein
MQKPPYTVMFSTFYKGLLFHNSLCLQDLLGYIIVWPNIKWRYCRSDLISLFVRHIGFTACRKVESTSLGLSLVI